jgi:LAO/AO transport system kinase
MLELGGKRDWPSPVLTTVASTGEGVAQVWQSVRDHRHHLESSGTLDPLRQRRLVGEMEAALFAGIQRRVRSTVPTGTWEAMTDQVADRQLDPWTAAERLLVGLDAD